MTDQDKAPEVKPKDVPPVEPTDTPPEPTGDKTFTQDEMNHEIQKRLARQSRQHDTELEEVQAKATKWDKQEEAGRSESEKLQRDLNTAQEQLEKAQVDSDNAVKYAAVTIEVGKQGIPAENVEGALKLADLKLLSLQDGTVQGAKEAVEVLLEQYPFLADGGTPKAPGLDGAAGNNSRSSQSLTPPESAMARKLGLTDEQYLTAKQSNTQGTFKEK